LKNKAIKIKDLVLASESYPVKEHVLDNKNCSYDYYVEFKDSKHTGGTIILDVYFDCDAFYLLIGVENDSSGQKKKLAKILEDNKLAHHQSSLYDTYFQLEKFEVFERESVIADKFKMLLNVVMK